ncbi:MAG: ElyC/SanA/YdcF family protein [Patescibacteria group bacterium]|nr:ElyC/SanA/YdcF family protein [Patescibacteria group bacterium]
MITYIVLGYGCHLTDIIKRYLHHACLYINQGDNVIVSGAYTNNKTAPNMSEAILMEDYLRDNYCLKNITKEDESITTLDNLINSKKIIFKNKKFEKAKIVIFCSSSRILKVWVMSLFIFGIPVPKIITFDMEDGWLEKMKQTFVAAPLDVASMFIPFLRKLQIQRKQRIIRMS